MIFDLVNSRACHVGVDVVVVVLVVCKEVRSRCALRDLMWVHVAVVWFARRMFFKCACVCVCVCVCVRVCVSVSGVRCVFQVVRPLCPFSVWSVRWAVFCENSARCYGHDQ